METDTHSVQCQCAPVSESTWSESQRRPSVAIVDAVASAEGVDATELGSLSPEIDLEALDQLLLNAAPDTCGICCLSIAGWNVFVSGDGHVLVCDPSETTPPAPVFEPISAD